MIVTVSDLSYQYQCQNRPALSHVSFTAEPGLTAILGPNGAGKSTLFRCILHIMPDYSGQITFDTHDSASLTHRQRASLVAYVPQIHHCTFSYSVFDVVLMGASGHLAPFSVPGQCERQITEETLERLELTHLARRSFSKLSGGEQQLVLIAQALAKRSSVLIMDEPTANLDYGNKIHILQKIRNLAEQGYTILLSTHDPQNALTYANSVLALKQGRVISHDDPQTVLTPALIRDLYGVFVRVDSGIILPQEKCL